MFYLPFLVLLWSSLHRYYTVPSQEALQVERAQRPPLAHHLARGLAEFVGAVADARHRHQAVDAFDRTVRRSMAQIAS